MNEVSDEQLYQWIRDREVEIVAMSTDPWGLRARRESQKILDYYCRELGRRGLN